MSDVKDDLEAATGSKVSEVKVEASKDGKPPYKHKIKTEAETVRELSGRDPIVINTEADPDYKDEEDDAEETHADSGSNS